MDWPNMREQHTTLLPLYVFKTQKK